MLIVDDDPLINELPSATPQGVPKTEYAITSAANAPDALDAIRRAPPDMSHAPQPARLAVLDTPPGVRRIALIIEDDSQFSDMLAVCLRAQGYQPVQCYRGQDAIAAARELRPALLTLDILLPDLDGWSVLREIRSAPRMQRVPVVIVSILKEAELGPDSGPTAFLRKPAPRAELIEAIARLAPAAPGAPTRVLFVDDDPLLAEMIELLLPSSRFNLQAVTDARRAAEALDAGLPDLILLDLIMPEVDGFEFLQTLRANPPTRHLPVLVLTAKHLSPQEQSDLSQAAQIVLTKKTFTPDHLAAKIRYLDHISPLIGLPAAAAPPKEAPFVETDMAQFRDDFLAEARKHLSRLSAGLVQGQQSEDTESIAVPPRDGDYLGSVRAAHTLKGTAGMMGYADLGGLAAQVESLLIGVMGGTLALDPPRLAQLRDLHRRMVRIVESL